MGDGLFCGASFVVLLLAALAVPGALGVPPVASTSPSAAAWATPSAAAPGAPTTAAAAQRSVVARQLYESRGRFSSAATFRPTSANAAARNAAHSSVDENVQKQCTTRTLKPSRRNGPLRRLHAPYSGRSPMEVRHVVAAVVVDDEQPAARSEAPARPRRSRPVPPRGTRTRSRRRRRPTHPGAAEPVGPPARPGRRAHPSSRSCAARSPSPPSSSSTSRSRDRAERVEGARELALDIEDAGQGLAELIGRARPGGQPRDGEYSERLPFRRSGAPRRPAAPRRASRVPSRIAASPTPPRPGSAIGARCPPWPDGASANRSGRRTVAVAWIGHHDEPRDAGSALVGHRRARRAHDGHRPIPQRRLGGRSRNSARTESRRPGSQRRLVPRERAATVRVVAARQADLVAVVQARRAGQRRLEQHRDAERLAALAAEHRPEARRVVASRAG